MIRGALWLVQVIGEGNTFTKNELRDAFPGVSQIDRRIRDLRDYGWVLYSSAEDATLALEDQRFVRAGVDVWNPKARKAAAPSKTITAKKRQAVLARDGYMCTICGIAGAETYLDSVVLTAVIEVSQRVITGDDGQEKQTLVTECKRCRSGGGRAPLGVSDAVSAAADLSLGELRRLQGWMERGRRSATELDRAWEVYLRVPLEDRGEVLRRLRETY